MFEDILREPMVTVQNIDDEVRFGLICSQALLNLYVRMVIKT